MNDNYDIFKELYDDILTYTLEEVIERWSGITLCVPAFCGGVRDVRILHEYHALPEAMGKEKKYYILARRFGVSNRKIATVIKSSTLPTAPTATPSLFDV